MDNSKPQQKSPPSRKNYAAVIGFAFALAGFVSYGLTAIPALIFCFIGFRHKRHRRLAVIGVVICLFFLLLHIIFITPMGTAFYPLNLLKYRIVCESHFWMDFDREHLVEAQSQRTVLFIGSEGSMYFKADMKDRYDPNQVISFAEKNGWIYGGKICLTREHFSQFLSGWEDVADEDFDSYIMIDKIAGPLWIKDGCTVLAFDTGNVHGFPSYVMICDDRSEMAVYSNHGAYPDPGYPFTLPPMFEKAE